MNRDPETGAIPLSRLRIAERSRMEEMRHSAVMASYGLLAPLVPAQVIAGRIAGVLAAPRADGFPFAIPTPLAIPHCGERLTVAVSPAEVDLVMYDWVAAGGRRFHVDRFFVGGGDWSPLLDPVEDSSICREARELHEAGMDRHATHVYRRYLERARAGRPVRRNKVPLATDAAVDAYFDRFVGLFESVRRHGILRRETLSRADEEALGGIGRELPMRRLWSEWVEKEIGVAISAHGELIKLPGGQHRTAIARVLGLATIPVQVRLVHRDWWRRTIAETGLPAVPALSAALSAIDMRNSLTTNSPIGALA